MQHPYMQGFTDSTIVLRVALPGYVLPYRFQHHFITSTPRVMCVSHTAAKSPCGKLGQLAFFCFAYCGRNYIWIDHCSLCTQSQITHSIILVSHTWVPMPQENDHYHTSPMFWLVCRKAYHLLYLASQRNNVSTLSLLNLSIQQIKTLM